MELRTYWSIIWRRIWVVILVVGVVALYVGYEYYHLHKTPGALKAYSSAITIQVGLVSTANSDPNNADYVTVSEALADTLANGPILSSHEFDQDVSNQISQDMSVINQRYGANPGLGDWQNVGAIGGALSAVRVNSLVTITTNWATSAGAWAIANAVGEVSTSKMGVFLDYVVTQDATHTSSSGNVQLPAVSARVISSATNPATVAGSSNSKVTLLIALLIVALILGIALTFLLDYLDDRLRDKDQIAHLLQLPVLGELPRAPSAGSR
ncbi:MAG TPA: hypothetical protein VNE38_16465 [Ktedonobacteraceae bacterium]|nr:hypothetical protein [Ktedonobacteraceae bacterium]